MVGWNCLIFWQDLLGDVPSTGLSPGKELQRETAGHLQNTRRGERDIRELGTVRSPSVSSAVIKQHIKLPINLHLLLHVSVQLSRKNLRTLNPWESLAPGPISASVLIVFQFIQLFSSVGTSSQSPHGEYLAITELSSCLWSSHSNKIQLTLYWEKLVLTNQNPDFDGIIKGDS